MINIQESTLITNFEIFQRAFHDARSIPKCFKNIFFKALSSWNLILSTFQRTQITFFFQFSFSGNCPNTQCLSGASATNLQSGVNGIVDARAFSCLYAGALTIAQVKWLSTCDVYNDVSREFFQKKYDGSNSWRQVFQLWNSEIWTSKPKLENIILIQISKLNW